MMTTPCEALGGSKCTYYRTERPRCTYYTSIWYHKSDQSASCTRSIEGILCKIIQYAQVLRIFRAIQLAMKVGIRSQCPSNRYAAPFKIPWKPIHTKSWMANWLKGVESSFLLFLDGCGHARQSGTHFLACPLLLLSTNSREKVGRTWQRRVVRNNNMTRGEFLPQRVLGFWKIVTQLWRWP